LWGRVGESGVVQRVFVGLSEVVVSFVAIGKRSPTSDRAQKTSNLQNDVDFSKKKPLL
jgi:hypothetical protein